MAQGQPIVVDGANIAYEDQTTEGKPRVAAIEAVHQALKERGYAPIIIVDASFRYEVDDPQRLEALFDAQVVEQAPAGTDADYFILETADRQDCRIISNDQYEAFTDKYAWIEDRRVPLMIIAGGVQFYKLPSAHS